MNLTTKDTKIFMDQSAFYDDFSELNKVLVEGTE
jgi:RNAse (barnase) inhibitor barstar